MPEIAGGKTQKTFVESKKIDFYLSVQLRHPFVKIVKAIRRNVCLLTV